MKKIPLYGILISLCLAYSLEGISQNKEEFDNLIFFVPPGLSVNKTDNSLLFTDASVGGGQYFTINVSRSTFSLKKIEKSFPVFWRESLLMDGMDNPVAEPTFVKAPTTSGWNSFRGGKPVQYSTQSPAFYYHLTVMKYLGITLRIVTRASSEEIFLQKYPLLMQLVSSVNFKTPPPKTNTNQVGTTNQGPSNPQTPNTNPSNSPPLQMNTLYMSVQGDIFSSTSQLAVLYFSPDGSVFIDIPEKGFSGFNMQEQKARSPEVFGAFSVADNNISVKMNNNAAITTYSIKPDGALQSSVNPGQLFNKLSPLDNYLFEGSFTRHPVATGAGTIMFYKDGKFSDNGLIKSILSNDAGGTGMYSIRQNSLTLRYADGRELQLCFYIMPEDLQNPNKILISNYLLVKQ